MENEYPPPGQYPEPPPAYGQPPPQPPAPKSNAWKWILIGCGGLFLLSILAAGGCIFAAFLWSKRMMDPENAKRVALEILPIEIPEGMTGQMGMSMLGVKMAHLVSVNDPLGGSSITLGTAPPGQEVQIRGQIQQLGSQQRRGGRARRSNEDFKFMGNDVTAEVTTFGSGDDERRAYEFELDYAGRLVLLSVQGPGAEVNSVMVQRLLDTVHGTDGEK